MRQIRSAVLALVGLLALAGGAAHGAFYVVVWGAQRPVIKDPRYSHSFATFIRTCPDGRLEHFTISWLPVNGEVHVLRISPEPGRNFGLAETLELCRRNRMEVARWGPYEVTEDLWARAVEQRGRLERGEVLYKGFDCGSSDGTVSNCLHAVSRITRPPGQEFPRVVVAPANWGESGSYWATLTLRPWFVEPCRTHDGLLTALGLDPCAYRKYGLRRSPAWLPTRAVQAPFQRKLLPNRVDCGEP
jgi:hypothetical protein